MKYFYLTCLIASVCASYTGTTSNKVKDAKVEGSYIITLKDNSRSTKNIDTHLAEVEGLFRTKSDKNKINYVYRNLGNKSYAAKLSDDVVDQVRKLEDVHSIVNDRVVNIDAVTLQTDAPWGISRISRRSKLPAVNYDKHVYNYTYNGQGSGVTVYSIDSGIKLSHPEFEGRAVFGKNFSPTPDVDDDENGHGTHTSGTIGSKTYGVAKKVKLVAVKVFDKYGSGTWASVIAALDWVVQDTVHKSSIGNVINMSLGGGKFDALDQAVEAAYAKGYVVVVSAGNENTDSCTRSPASAPNAITVGAVDTSDRRTSFSCFGKCVDVFAPGHYILSTYTETETDKLSGTSMSAPHVAGLAAYLISNDPSLTNAGVATKIKDLSTKNVVLNAGDGSPNLLVFNGIV